MLNHGSRKSKVQDIDARAPGSDFAIRRHKRAVSLPGDLLIWLEDASDVSDVPQSRIVEKALRAYIEQCKASLATPTTAAA